MFFSSNLLYIDSSEIEDLNFTKGSTMKFNLCSISVRNKNGLSLAILIICFKKCLGDSNPHISFEIKLIFMLFVLLMFNSPKDRYPSINFNFKKITLT